MWAWVERNVVLAIHEEQLAEHGGVPGLRDSGLLDSALARPRNLLAYGDPDAQALAAAYACGLVRNHPFLDGNKRVGAVVMELFLDLNGLELTADDAALVTTLHAVAEGGLSESDLADWLRANTKAASERRTDRPEG